MKRLPINPPFWWVLLAILAPILIGQWMFRGLPMMPHPPSPITVLSAFASVPIWWLSAFMWNTLVAARERVGGLTIRWPRRNRGVNNNG